MQSLSSYSSVRHGLLRRQAQLLQRIFRQNSIFLHSHRPQGGRPIREGQLRSLSLQLADARQVLYKFLSIGTSITF